MYKLLDLAKTDPRLAKLLNLTLTNARELERFIKFALVGTPGILTHLAVHNFFDNLYVHGMYVHIAILLGLLYIVSRQGVSRHAAQAAGKPSFLSTRY